jgi:RNA polymerase sigma-70 factor, ECF subfamily
VAFGKTTLENKQMLGQLDTERQAWLAELYESNYAPVFKTCSNVLRNPEDAADASQEVFLIAADSLRPGTTRATARAWLQTVARNHCVDVLRRRKRLGRVLVTLGPDNDERDDVAAAVADRDLVGAIFKRLSPVERQALWQSAVEHRAVTDIAGRLQLSYMAAAQVISRARRHALQLAARVAIALGVIRLGRNAGRLSLTAARVAALPMITLSAIAIQTSGTPATAAALAGPGITAPAIHRSTPGPQAGSVNNAPSKSGGLVLPSPLPSSPSSTIGSVVDRVGQSVDAATTRHIAPPLPGVGVPVPLPSLPATSPIPSPSIPSLP